MITKEPVKEKKVSKKAAGDAEGNDSDLASFFRSQFDAPNKQESKKDKPKKPSVAPPQDKKKETEEKKEEEKTEEKKSDFYELSAFLDSDDIQDAASKEEEEEDGDEDQLIDEKKEEEEEEIEKEGEKEEILVTAEGKQVSKKAADAFKELKSALTERDNEISDLKKRLEETTSKVQALSFDESDDFKRKYVKPIEDASAKASEWLQISGMSQEELVGPLNLAKGKLAAGDSAGYFDAIEKIAQEMKPSVASGFRRAMESLFDAHKDYSSAKADLSKTRDEIKKGTAASFPGGESWIRESVGRSINGFEAENKAAIDFYNHESNVERFRYKEKSESAKELVAGELKNFSKTGVLSDRAISLMVHGAMTEIRDIERETLFASMDKMRLQLMERDALIKKAHEKLKRISAVPEGKSNGGSLKKDSKDESTSLVDYWRKQFSPK